MIGIFHMSYMTYIICPICSYVLYIYIHTHFFFFFNKHLWHVEVPRLDVESELHLPAYSTATAMQDPSHIYNLHHSSQQ